jgi:hypothetical protein
MQQFPPQGPYQQQPYGGGGGGGGGGYGQHQPYGAQPYGAPYGQPYQPTQPYGATPSLLQRAYCCTRRCSIGSQSPRSLLQPRHQRLPGLETLWCLTRRCVWARQASP